MDTHLVTLALLLTSILGTQSQECWIETRDDLPKDNQPLYLNDGGPYKQIEPTLKGNKSIIAVKPGASITLACNGEGNYLLTGGKPISKATCDDDGGFRVEGRSVSLKAVTCKSPVKPTVKETKTKCGHDQKGAFYQVGFQVEDTWMEVYRACHDVESASTLYVDHVVSKMVESGAVRNNERPSFKEGHTSLYKGLSVSSLYKKKKQKELLETQLERDDYINDKDSFLSRGHMAADADFVYSNNQHATYFYINTAPQWYSVNRGNWYSIEKKVKQLAAKLVLLAVGLASGTHYGSVSSQYFSQDGLGGYKYGYKSDLSSKDEVRSHDGTTKGSFSYVDGYGHLQSAHYVADPHHGFRVQGTNLPVAPQSHHGYAAAYAYHGAPLKPDGTVDDLPEVKAARAAHLAQYYKVLHRHARSLYNPAPLNPDGTVDHLPEVKHATAAHLAAVALEKSKHGSHYAHTSYHYPSYSAGYKHYEPAPLNHDGTVADTPAIKHAKAVHFAAVQKAKSQAYHSPSYYHYPVHAPAYNHYEPAPLNHDGTVAETPEVKHAKAVHFALYNEALHRYKRSYYEPAPLNHDGTVADTPAIKHAKAVHFTAVQQAKSQAYHSPSYYNYPVHAPSHKYYEPAPLNHDGTVADTPAIKHAKAVHFAAVQKAKAQSYHSPSYYHYPVHAPAYKHYEPAPLNHDGTVADTPAIKHAKAVHFSLYHEALSRTAPYHHY